MQFTTLKKLWESPSSNSLSTFLRPTIYEEDGSVSNRFSVNFENDKYGIVLNDNHAIDHEFESTVYLSAVVSDGIDTSNVIEFSIEIVDMTTGINAEVDTTPVPLDDFDTTEFTVEYPVNDTDVDVSHDNARRFIIRGDTDANNLKGGGLDDIIIGGTNDDTLEGLAGNDDFIFEFNSETILFESGSDTINNFNVGEDTIILGDTQSGHHSDSIYSLQDFLRLFVGSGDGLSLSLLTSGTGNDIKVTGVELKRTNGGDEDGITVNYFDDASNPSTTDTFSGTKAGIIQKLGFDSNLSDEEFNSNYVDTNNSYRLQENAFTVEVLQALFGSTGIYINDIHYFDVYTMT